MTKPADSSALDAAFVWATGDSSPAATSHRARMRIESSTASFAPPRASKGLLERAGGRVTRRMTMYLDPALAQRVVLHCAETGREISDIAALALERYLASPGE